MVSFDISSLPGLSSELKTKISQLVEQTLEKGNSTTTPGGLQGTAGGPDTFTPSSSSSSSSGSYTTSDKYASSKTGDTYANAYSKAVATAGAYAFSYGGPEEPVKPEEPEPPKPTPRPEPRPPELPEFVLPPSPPEIPEEHLCTETVKLESGEEISYGTYYYSPTERNIGYVPDEAGNRQFFAVSYQDNLEYGADGARLNDPLLSEASNKTLGRLWSSLSPEEKLSYGAYEEDLSKLPSQENIARLIKERPGEIALIPADPENPFQPKLPENFLFIPPVEGEDYESTPLTSSPHY